MLLRSVLDLVLFTGPALLPAATIGTNPPAQPLTAARIAAPETEVSTRPKEDRVVAALRTRRHRP